MPRSNRALGEYLARRTVEDLNDRGIRAEKVQRPGKWEGGDPFGVIDVLAVHDEVLHGIQVSVQGERSKKIRKICEANLQCNIKLMLWKKVKGRWECTTSMDVWSCPSQIPKLIRGRNE